MSSLSTYDRGIYYEGVAWTFSGLALIAVTTRLYTRCFLTRTAGLDDIFIIVALVRKASQDVCHGCADLLAIVLDPRWQCRRHNRSSQRLWQARCLSQRPTTLRRDQMDLHRSYTQLPLSLRPQDFDHDLRAAASSQNTTVAFPCNLCVPRPELGGLHLCDSHIRNQMHTISENMEARGFRPLSIFHCGS